jgi:hypothetical protein
MVPLRSPHVSIRGGKGGKQVSYRKEGCTNSDPYVKKRGGKVLTSVVDQSQAIRKGMKRKTFAGRGHRPRLHTTMGIR